MLEAKVLSFEEMLCNHTYVAYTCTGYSMLPLLRQRRDIVVIKSIAPQRCKKYDVVLYRIGDEYILHRVLKVQKNDYVICGDHNITREYGITDDQIIGVMTRVIRGSKSIYTTNWKYRLYVHLWCDLYPIRVIILYTIMKAKAAGRIVKRLLFMKKKDTNEKAR